MFRAGPFYFTPRLRIGTIGLDTNVFYTPTERQTDFTSSGGPGLEIVLPIRSSARFSVEGGIDYVYFLRTESQRRLAGDGQARLDVSGPRAELGLEGGYRRTFSRPNFEVDERIVQDETRVLGEGHVELGERVELRPEAGARRLDVPDGQEFGGADLSRTLTHDSFLGRLTLAYRLTLKTALLLEGDYEVDRFPHDDSRDADSNRAGLGFEVRSTTRLSGRAVGGVRSFRMRTGVAAPAETNAVEPYAQVDLTYAFGPRTSLQAIYNRDIQYSAFDPVTGRPVIHMQTYRLNLQKGLVGALDVRLFGGLTKLRSDGVVRIEVAPDETVVGVRDDDAWEFGADLGYTFRGHLRFGAAASYTERISTFDDFGIDGLLVGGTITFTP
jgi:hypothetical protein